jgi:hypothetical protein
MGYTPPWLKISQGSGVTNLYGNGVTTDDLLIYANPTDVRSKIMLYGGGGIDIIVTAGFNFNLYDGAVNPLRLSYNGTDMNITTPIADKNLALLTTGTGLLKFGTYGAQGDTVTSGYITILDNAGNSRKLAIIA